MVSLYLNSYLVSFYIHAVGANKATEGKEISNVATESTTMATEAASEDIGSKGALASKDATER